MNIKILGCGHKLPDTIVKNDLFKKTVNKDDEWIYKKTGIRQRHIIKSNQEYNDIIYEACKDALNNSHIESSEIDLVILATSTPSSMFGGVSCITNRLGINNAISFDITLACNGFNTAFITAYQFIKNNNCKKCLLIGADCLSRWVDWSDYKTSILFGDGCGAIVIEGTETNAGLLDYLYKTDSSKNNVLNINVNEYNSFVNNIEVKNNGYDMMNMIGREVADFVLENIPSLIQESLAKNNLGLNDIKYILSHQANQVLLDKIADELQIPRTKILSNIEKYGNTSAASIPILFSEIFRDKLLSKNDKIMFLGFGAGMSSSIIIFEYE